MDQTESQDALNKNPSHSNPERSSQHLDDLLKHPFWYFIKKHRLNFLLGLMALVLTNCFDILSPYLIGKTIDLIAENQNQGFSNYIVLLVGVASGTAVFRYLWRIYFSRFHQQVAADLRNILFKKLMRLNLRFHSKLATGEKMTLLTQDIDNFRMGIGPGILILCDSIVYTLGTLPLMILVSFSWTWKCLIFMPLIPILVYKLENSFIKRYRNLQDQTGELTSFAQESVSGIKVIKSLSLQNFRSQIFNPINTKLQDYGLRVDKIESFFGPTLELFVMIGTATLLFVGSKDVINSEVSLGNFFAFYQYLLRMIWPMTAIGLSFMRLKEADSSFNRIKEVLISDKELPAGKIKTQKGFSLEIDSLRYHFPQTQSYSLYNISFKLQPNESVALVGPIGSGKSTLAQILARSINKFEGSLTYGHTPIVDIQKNDFRKIASLVPQEVFLFKDSIKGNLHNFMSQEVEKKPSSKAKHAAILESLKQVQLEKEVNELQEGIETQLQEKGQGLSGGQRQRLTLARGLLQKPQWLILDDSLSAVDIATEQKIMEHLKNIKDAGLMNFIICSHRIQNIKWVNKIIVLDQGRIVKIGTHDDLIQTCDLYKELYASNKKQESNNSMRSENGS